MKAYPSLEAFLTMPIEEVRKVAPTSLILAAGGTRRKALLNGISPTSNDYARHTRKEMISCLDLIFTHGVQHIITPIIAETTYRENTPGHSEKILAWIDWGIAGPEALADYVRFGWQVRLVGTEHIPELQAAARRLETATGNSPRKIWFIVEPDPEQMWISLFHTIREQHIQNRADAIRAIYGENIPLATLYLDFGKPQIFSSNVPPLLVDQLQCYWRQHLGYALDELSFRRILYDYAYQRKTWKEDKTGRAEQVFTYQEVWQDPPIIGLGTRLGPFWYPASTPSLPFLEKDQ